MEAIAAAIIGALLAGARDVAKQSVFDAYKSAKSVLQKFIPNFDVDSIQADEKAAETELGRRLSGLMDNERAEVLREFKNLAETAELTDVAVLLGDTIAFKKVVADGDIEVDLETTGKDRVSAEDVSSGGKITIKKTIRKPE